MAASDLEPLFAEVAKERQRESGGARWKTGAEQGKAVKADLPEANKPWQEQAREQVAKAVGAKGRNVSTGARAMATALVLQADGRRENGRWAYGATRQLLDSQQLSNSTWRGLLNQCGIVLDHAPHLATDVPQDRGIPPKLLGDSPITRGGNPGFWISGARVNPRSVRWIRSWLRV